MRPEEFGLVAEYRPLSESCQKCMPLPSPQQLIDVFGSFPHRMPTAKDALDPFKVFVESFPFNLERSELPVRMLLFSVEEPPYYYLSTVFTAIMLQWYFLTLA